MKYDVFISFPMEANNVAEQFKSYMEASGLTVYKYPHKMRWGDNLWKEIESALNNSLTVLAILTEPSIRSSGVAREINIAVSTRKKIYPLFDRYTHPNEHHQISEIYWRKLEYYDIPTLAQEIIDGVYEIKRRNDFWGGVLVLAVGVGAIYLAKKKKEQSANEKCIPIKNGK